MPADLLKEKVEIYCPTRNPEQQGREGRVWKLRFPAIERWKNPLMGWVSANSTIDQLRLMEFGTKQEAIDYCESKGFHYDVTDVKTEKKEVKSYADNFSSKKYGFTIPKKK